MLKKHSTHPSRVLTVVLVLLFALYSGLGSAQIYESIIGIRASPKVLAVTGKIPIDRRNVLEGTVGFITPQPDFTMGVGAAYHRQILLNDTETFQAYFGIGGLAVIGDFSSLGLSGQTGLMYLFKRIDIGLDLYPTYFFNEKLKFKPLFGLHLRWINGRTY